MNETNVLVNHRKKKNMYLIDEPVLRSAIHAISAWDWVMDYETKQNILVQ